MPAGYIFSKTEFSSISIDLLNALENFKARPHFWCSFLLNKVLYSLSGHDCPAGMRARISAKLKDLQCLTEKKLNCTSSQR